MSFDFFPFEEDLATAGIHYSDWSKFSYILEQDYDQNKIGIMKILDQLCTSAIGCNDQNSIKKKLNLNSGWDIGEIYLLKFVNMNSEKKELIKSKIKKYSYTNLDELSESSFINYFHQMVNDDDAEDFLNIDFRFDFIYNQENVTTTDWKLVPFSYEFVSLLSRYKNIRQINESIYFLTADINSEEKNVLEDFKIRISSINFTEISYKICITHQLDDFFKFYRYCLCYPIFFEVYANAIKFKFIKIDNSDTCSKFQSIIEDEKLFLKNTQELKRYIILLESVRNTQNPNFLEFVKTVKSLVNQ